MAIDWSIVEHFSPSEFDHPDRLSDLLIYTLDWVRTVAERPIYITSDVRPSDDGEHGDGNAVDISDNLRGKPIGSRWRFRVLQAAFDAGFRRVGIYDRHIHLGVGDDRDQDVAWIGESQ